MCGRFSQSSGKKKKLRYLQSDLEMPEVPRYNVAPTQMVAVYRALEGQPVPAVMRWGLVPVWADDPSYGLHCINARSETARTKSSFRSAFKSRHCLVPVDGFYEWEKQGKLRLPWHFVRPDGEPFWLAGLWDSWHPKDKPELVMETFTVLTTTPNAVAAPVHDRMPVILDQDQAAEWLNAATPEAAEALLKPCPDDQLTRHRVSTVVNKAGNDVPECVERIPVQADLGSQ